MPVQQLKMRLRGMDHLSRTLGEVDPCQISGKAAEYVCRLVNDRIPALSRQPVAGHTRL